MKRKPLKTVAIGDYSKKTGLGAALAYPLEHLTKAGILDPILLGVGFDGWGTFLEDPPPYPVLPMFGDVSGRDCLHNFLAKYEKIRKESIDIVFTMMDLQRVFYLSEPKFAVENGKCLGEALQFISKAARKFRHVAYFPVDGMEPGERMSPFLSMVLKGLEYPITCTNWFRDRAIVQTNRKISMIWHGVDTKIFKPIPRQEVLMKLGIIRMVPEDCFIVGMIGTNQERKKFEDFIPAVAEAIKQNKKIFFYCFTDLNSNYPGSHDLKHLIRQCGIWDHYIDLELLLNISENAMPLIYGLADLSVLLSIGEGFGIPPIYSRAMGIPCLITDCTALTETCADDYEKIPAKWTYLDAENLVRYITDTEALVKKIVFLSRQRQRLLELGEKCQRVMMEKFDYETVIYPQWEREFEIIEKGIKDDPPMGKV